MYSDAKRIHLLEKLLKVRDNGVLERVERILDDSYTSPQKAVVHSPLTEEQTTAEDYDDMLRVLDEDYTIFERAAKGVIATSPIKREPLNGKYLDLSAVAGTITKEEGDELDRIIEEGCEQIHPSELKNPLDDE